MIRAVRSVFVGLQIVVSVFLLAPIVAMAQSSENDELRVTLASGREFSGHVDPRTDNERLWLRAEGTATEVIRPIDWQRITAAEWDGSKLTAAELREMADQLKSPSAIKTLRLHSVDEDGAVAGDTANRPQETHAEQAVSAGPIRSVDFDAQIANWDGDVEPDGLLVHLFPLDGNGDMTPVSGTLWVELIAPRRRKYHEVPHGRGASVERIGCWSQLIRTDDLTAGGIVVKLPFQAIHPSFDEDIDTYGLVHLRLTVPGHGVFEDSYDGVRTRRVFTPTRDAILPSATGRYFHTERTGRGRRSWGR